MDEADRAMVESAAGVLHGAEIPWSTLSLMLKLSRLRSEFLVAQALAERYPTETSFREEFLYNPDTVEELDAFAQIVEDVRTTAPHLHDELTPESVARAAAPHIGRTFDAIALSAERLGCTPEDLLVTLIG